MQKPFVVSLQSQLLFTKNCYSFISMVFLWSSFLDIISSCLCAVNLAAHKGRNIQAGGCQSSSSNIAQDLLGQVALATTKFSILSETSGNTIFSRGKFRIPLMIQCWLRGRKISFSLNKSNTQHSRPISIKFQFYFCFVLHTHFPTHMMAHLSKYWVNSV